MGVGMVLSVMTMLVSGIGRAAPARAHGAARRLEEELHLVHVVEPRLPMSAFWLMPQLAALGLSEMFNQVSQMEFYYKQFPENMRSVAGALLFLGFAVASYASGLMVTVVHRTTGGSDGRPDWLTQDLNQGRVDLYYLVIAGMAAVNLVYFVACARWYRFKESADHAGAVELEEKDKVVVVTDAGAAAPPPPV